MTPDRGLRPRIVYTDLDGTLLGPGGSLFAGSDGRPSRRAAEAVARLLEAGIAIVPVSGRTGVQMREAARILSARDFIAELGGLTFYDLGREIVRDYGVYEGERTPFEAMAESGAGALLLEELSGRFELHLPWAHEPRECSMLFRGFVEVGEATGLLERSGYDWLELRDNGVIARDYPGLRVPEVHAYHLLPRGVEKRGAVAADLTRRGIPPEEAAAVGDSPADAALAEAVDRVYIVANGWPAVQAAGPWPGKVAGTEASHGDGFAEAVGRLLDAGG